MTVKELIEILEDFPQELEVRMPSGFGLPEVNAVYVAEFKPWLRGKKNILVIEP